MQITLVWVHSSINADMGRGPGWENKIHDIIPKIVRWLDNCLLPIYVSDHNIFYANPEGLLSVKEKEATNFGPLSDFITYQKQTKGHHLKQTGRTPLLLLKHQMLLEPLHVLHRE